MSGNNTPIIPRKRNANHEVKNRPGKHPIHAAIDETQTQHSGFPDPATNRDPSGYVQTSLVAPIDILYHANLCSGMKLRSRPETIQVEDPGLEAIDQGVERKSIELSLENTAVEDAELQARISTGDWPRLLKRSRTSKTN